VHARRAFADAVKAADKKDPGAVKSSVAYQALQKIAEFGSIPNPGMITGQPCPLISNIRRQ